MPTVGSPEIIIIAIVILLIFGAKKIPEFVRGIGQAVVEFKKALKGKE
jgi:sec-independent protein translocase protein TatA